MNTHSLYLTILFLIISCKSDPQLPLKKEKSYHIPSKQFEAFDDFLNNNKQFNQKIVFYLDLELASNQNRFFVLDVKTDSIIQRGLVTHGSCTGTTAPRGEVYSNIPDSYCSSLGKYKIGKPYKGKFGLAYKLHGLEESNSKAFARYIVLHAHECVPDQTVNYQICLSQGCPTVSPIFLQLIAEYIDNSDEPILLWMDDQSNLAIDL